MKIEQLIVQFLYTNKKVTLQDIGIFYMSPNVTIPADQDKDLSLPENAISFEYNTKTVQDENLIDFIVQQTRKIKPLATSDLESFTILGRQFMNIGKPLLIEGLGILQKNQLGEYEFIQGNTINARLEPVPALLREKNKEDIVFTTPARKQQNVTGIIIGVVIFLLLAASAAVYFLFMNKADSKTEQLAITNPDSLARTPVTQQASIPAASNPGAVALKPESFKVVLREYRMAATSDISFKKLTTDGHKLIQYSTDSVTHRIAMEFARPISDTTFVKDSLKTIFAGNPIIEIN